MIATQKEKTFAGLLALLAAAIIGIVAWLAGSSPSRITGYDDCVARGGRALETYPEQCVAPDGTGFTRPIK